MSVSIDLYILPNLIIYLLNEYSVFESTIWINWLNVGIPNKDEVSHCFELLFRVNQSPTKMHF